MKNGMINLILIVFLLISANVNTNAQQSDSALQIYLPRDITIAGDVPNLGQVAIVRGNQSLIAVADKIALGRISKPGQKLIIDRSLVLSRLASNGISASDVKFTGAEKLTVTQQYEVIKGEEFMEKALVFLKKNLPCTSICQLDPVRKPKDMILSKPGQDLRYSVAVVKSGIQNQAKVRVALLSNDKEIGMREVNFRLKYDSYRAVTKVDIPVGTAITGENVKIEKVVSNYPEADKWLGPQLNGISENTLPRVPESLVATRRIPANTILRQGMTGPVKPMLVIKRNQNVAVVFDSPGLSLSVYGKARKDGRVGEYIEVEVRITTTTQRILARVNEDGTVRPVF